MTSEIEDLLTCMTDTASGRKKLIETISVDHEDNWQNVSTPYDIVREMCDLVPEATHFCVLFSMEFLEVLVKERGVPCENVLFFGDNKLEADMAGHPTMYGVNTRILDKQTIVGNGFDSSALSQSIKEGVDTMKFNKLAVLMNPPYQISDGGGKKGSGGAVPVYHCFISTIIDKLSPDYLTSINPSRWMAGGKGRHLATLDKFRERMVADKRIRKIVHFPGHNEVFSSVSIAGGVNYFLWDKSYNGLCEFVVGNTSMQRTLDTYDLIVQDNNAVIILDKVFKVSSKWVSQGVFGRKPFGLATNFKDWQSTGSPCYSRGQKLNYCHPSVIADKHGIKGKWKVVTSGADGAAQNEDNTGAKRVLGNCFIIPPGSVCVETYIVVNVFDTKKQAENFITYMKTKFFRFLLGLRVVTQHITKDKFAWVPDVEDYSTAWTDKELYDKFGLTRQERTYIESKIKERE